MKHEQTCILFSTGIVGGGNSNKVYQLLMQMEMLSWNERISNGEWKKKQKQPVHWETK